MRREQKEWEDFMFASLPGLKLDQEKYEEKMKKKEEAERKKKARIEEAKQEVIAKMNQQSQINSELKGYPKVDWSGEFIDTRTVEIHSANKIEEEEDSFVIESQGVVEAIANMSDSELDVMENIFGGAANMMPKI